MPIGTVLAFLLGHVLTHSLAQSCSAKLPVALDGRSSCDCTYFGDAITIYATVQDTGARFRSKMLLMPPFRVSATLQTASSPSAASASGMVTAFYLSTGEGSSSQTEADFEFLGKDPMGMQTNFFVRGVGGHEQWTHLNFDTSAAAHTYTFDASESTVKWLVDGVEVRSEKLALPAVWVYLSLWDASQHPDWAGRVDWSHGPFSANFVRLEI